MTLTKELPSFVSFSRNLSPALKRAAYVELRAAAQATLQGETNVILKQATLACLIKMHLPYAYWAGFYNVEQDQLLVGPYQGTLACLSIPIGRGVCGRAAQLGQTLIEVDVHALAEGRDHITCDPNSASEIVVPCFRENKSGQRELFAVLDIDSTELASFDETDRTELEALLSEVFG